MFTEDLTEFLDVDEHAIAGTVGTSTVNGIFDRAYIEAMGMVSGANPIFLIDSDDVATAAVGSTISIGGTSYKIRNAEPQDDGALSLLQLEKQ